MKISSLVKLFLFSKQVKEHKFPHFPSLQRICIEFLVSAATFLENYMKNSVGNIKISRK